MIVRVVRVPEIARIAGTTGHDFIFIDNQHAAFNPETISQLALAALGAGVAPLVRVRSYDDPDIPHLLDAGVMGIVVPNVNSAEQARHAVSISKFPPVGRRSVGGPSPYLEFKPLPNDDAMRVLNAATVVVCMIEDAEGLDNVEEIAAVDGVDVLHIGCNDFLAEIGKSGDFECPELVGAIEKVLSVARDNGLIVGLGGDKDLGRQAKWAKAGVGFITTQSDMAMLMAEATRRTGELRKVL
jgi:2-keto-3-deoxy-L-rhamnonate aldolase RhmA